jgi:hypothetical protein
MTSDTIIKFFLIYLKKKEKRSPSLPKNIKVSTQSNTFQVLKNYHRLDYCKKCNYVPRASIDKALVCTKKRIELTLNLSSRDGVGNIKALD